MDKEKGNKMVLKCLKCSSCSDSESDEEEESQICCFCNKTHNKVLKLGSCGKEACIDCLIK